MKEPVKILKNHSFSCLFFDPPPPPESPGFGWRLRPAGFVKQAFWPPLPRFFAARPFFPVSRRLASFCPLKKGGFMSLFQKSGLFAGGGGFSRFSARPAAPPPAFAERALKQGAALKQPAGFSGGGGFSIVEFAVISALMGIMLTGTLAWMTSIQKSSNRAASQSSEISFKGYLSEVVSPAVCKDTFSGKNIGDSIDRIKLQGKYCYNETGAPAGPNPDGCRAAAFDAACDTLQNPLKPCAAAADCGAGNYCQSRENVYWDIAARGGLYGQSFKVIKALTAPAGGSVTPGRAELQVFYSRPGTQFERRDSSKPCSAADHSGCHKLSCPLKLSGTPLRGSVGDAVGACELLSCGGGSGSWHAGNLRACLKLQDGGRLTLAGCGGTSENAAAGTSAFGHGAGGSSSTGSNNTFVGAMAGESNAAGRQNVFVGYEAGKENTSGKWNVFVGDQSGKENTTGTGNTFIGEGAGMLNTSGTDNISLGTAAEGSKTGAWNIAIGFRAGNLNGTGSNNIFIGKYAGGTTSTNSSLFGTKSLANNVLIGHHAGSRFAPTAPNEARYNTFVGIYAGEKTNTGRQNVFMGYEAGKENTSGYWNVFVGDQTGENNTIGTGNTFIGEGAGFKNTTGSNNTFIGQAAGDKTIDGGKNTFLGDRAGWQNISGSGNIFIGRQAADTSAYQTANNKFVVGNAGSRTWIQGNIGTSALTVNGRQVCLQGVHSCTVASSKAYKKNIRPFRDFEKSLADILKTPLFSYQYRENHPESHTGKKRMGLIAEELPKNLRIKSGGLPPAPDWPTVYGTLWAGIKALAARLGGLRGDLISLLNSRMEGMRKDMSSRFQAEREARRRQMEEHARRNAAQNLKIERQAKKISDQSQIIQEQGRRIELLERQVRALSSKKDSSD